VGGDNNALTASPACQRAPLPSRGPNLAQCDNMTAKFWSRQQYIMNDTQTVSSGAGDPFLYCVLSLFCLLFYYCAMTTKVAHGYYAVALAAWTDLSYMAPHVSV